MDLLFLGKVLWRKLWILVSVPLIAAFAAFLFTMDITDTYVSRAQLATGFTIQDQVQLTEEKFNSREADIKFSNLMSAMNSGLAVNLTSYRLLLHDLDPKQVPFHRPDPEKFSTTPAEVAKVRDVVSAKLRNFSALASSDISMEQILSTLDGIEEQRAYGMLDELNKKKPKTTNEVFNVAKKHITTDFDVEVFRKPFNDHVTMKQINLAIQYGNQNRKTHDVDFVTAKAIMKKILIQKEKEFLQKSK